MEVNNRSYIVSNINSSPARRRDIGLKWHLGKPLKKTIESVSMLIPRGGGVLKPALKPP